MEYLEVGAVMVALLFFVIFTKEVLIPTLQTVGILKEKSLHNNTEVKNNDEKN